MSINNIGPAQVNGDIAVLSNDSDGDIESKVGTIEEDNPPIYINDADKLYRETIWDKSAGSGGLSCVRQGTTFCEPDKTLRKPLVFAYLTCARARM